MMVRIVVVVLLLGLVAVLAFVHLKEAESYGCLHNNYLDLWLDVDAIFQAYVVSEFRIDGGTGYRLDVTRVWKGRPLEVVTVRTHPGWEPRLPRQGVENLLYFKEGYDVAIRRQSDGTCVALLAKDFAGSELGALRIINYSLWGITVVMAAVLALILRAGWRRRAR